MYYINNLCFGVEVRELTRDCLIDLVSHVTKSEVDEIICENDLFEAFDITGWGHPFFSLYHGDDESPVVLGFRIDSFAAFERKEIKAAKADEADNNNQKVWLHKFNSSVSKEIRAILNNHGVVPGSMWVVSTS